MQQSLKKRKKKLLSVFDIFFSSENRICKFDSMKKISE